MNEILDELCKDSMYFYTIDFKRDAWWVLKEYDSCPLVEDVKEFKEHLDALEYMEKLNKARKFFSEAKVELKKVVWPSKRQTMSSTRVVVIFVALISVFLGLVDFVLSRLVKFILS